MTRSTLSLIVRHADCIRQFVRVQLDRPGGEVASGGKMASGSCWSSKLVLQLDLIAATPCRHSWLPLRKHQGSKLSV